MIFDEKELICFNSILAGKKILGISIEDKEEMNTGEYIKDTIVSLKEKGIIDGEGNISKIGVLPIRALEQYKNCKNHIVINNTCIGLINNQETIDIKKVKDCYDISRVNKLSIITQILKKSSFLRGSLSVHSSGNKLGKISMDIEELLTKDSIHMIKYLEKSIISDKIFFYDDKQGFSYDLIGKILKEVKPHDIKSTIVTDFDIQVVGE